MKRSDSSAGRAGPLGPPREVSARPAVAPYPMKDLVPDPIDAATGLHRIREWRTVYWIVFGIFVLWVGLLTWLTFAYS